MQYLSEARRLEQQGEFVEAIWCYETILRDPMAAQDPQIYQAAGHGLGLLLIGEARHCDEPLRTGRLLNRAISALTETNRIQPPDAALTLSLIEAHAFRFQLTGQTQDLFAANLLLDAFTRSPESDPAMIDKAGQLRLALARPARL